MNKPTIQDIAAQAKVSTATVSYVLNGTRNVRPVTRDRVLKVIEELNYRPSSIARSLKKQRSQTIGVIAEDVTVFNVPEIIDGIHDYADSHNLHILLTNLRLHKRIGRDFSRMNDYRSYAESSVAELISRQVEGIIYIGVHPRDVTGLIDTQGLPIVYTYCYTDHDVSIQYNDEQASFEAVSYLVKKGHTDIGVICGSLNSIPARLRFNGYYRAVSEFLLPIKPELIKIGDWEADSGCRLAKELFGLTQRPTAIMAMNDVMAAGVIQAATESNLRIPEDVSLVGFDNREFSAYMIPNLTTMDLPLHEMGMQAMEVLSELIEGTEEGKQMEQPLCKMIERGSVASPNLLSR